MLKVVLIANPATRRIELFQQALARFGLPLAEVFAYENLLTDRVALQTWDAPNGWFRFEAPERNFAIDLGLIAQGASVG
jgi:hypothetical protein